MPIRTFKKIVASGNTMALEFYLSIYALLFGIWLMIPTSVFTPSVHEVIHMYGGHYALGITIIIIGLVQYFALWRNYPRWQWLGGLIGLCFWLIFATALMIAKVDNPQMGFFLLNAISCAWILIRSRLNMPVGSNSNGANVDPTNNRRNWVDPCNGSS